MEILRRCSDSRYPHGDADYMQHLFSAATEWRLLIVGPISPGSISLAPATPVAGLAKTRAHEFRLIPGNVMIFLAQHSSVVTQSSCEPRERLRHRVLGVYLVSVSGGHQRDLMETARPNRQLLRFLRSYSYLLSVLDSGRCRFAWERIPPSPPSSLRLSIE